MSSQCGVAEQLFDGHPSPQGDIAGGAAVILLLNTTPRTTTSSITATATADTTDTTDAVIASVEVEPRARIEQPGGYAGYDLPRGDPRPGEPHTVSIPRSK